MVALDSRRGRWLQGAGGILSPWKETPLVPQASETWSCGSPQGPAAPESPAGAGTDGREAGRGEHEPWGRRLSPRGGGAASAEASTPASGETGCFLRMPWAHGTSKQILMPLNLAWVFWNDFRGLRRGSRDDVEQNGRNSSMTLGDDGGGRGDVRNVSGGGWSHEGRRLGEPKGGRCLEAWTWAWGRCRQRLSRGVWGQHLRGKSPFRSEEGASAVNEQSCPRERPRERRERRAALRSLDAFQLGSQGFSCSAASKRCCVLTGPGSVAQNILPLVSPNPPWAWPTLPLPSPPAGTCEITTGSRSLFSCPPLHHFLCDGCSPPVERIALISTTHSTLQNLHSRKRLKLYLGGMTERMTSLGWMSLSSWGTEGKAGTCLLF